MCLNKVVLFFVPDCLIVQKTLKNKWLFFVHRILQEEKQQDFFASKTISRYPCEDHVSECKRWARDHPDSCSDPAHEAFGLMSLACMGSCNRCGPVRSGGCVDELEKCGNWARLGCAKNPVGRNSSHIYSIK